MFGLSGCVFLAMLKSELFPKCVWFGKTSYSSATYVWYLACLELVSKTLKDITKDIKHVVFTSSSEESTSCSKWK